MTSLTVVDGCLRYVGNRFQLVGLAAMRARQLMNGKPAKVPWDNDKPTVVALREIEAGYVHFNHQEVSAASPEEALFQKEKPDQQPILIEEENHAPQAEESAATGIESEEEK